MVYWDRTDTLVFTLGAARLFVASVIGFGMLIAFQKPVIWNTGIIISVRVIEALILFRA